MQTGNIYKHGKWWVLRYRKTVLVNGQSERQRIVEKLHIVDDQHRSESSLEKVFKQGQKVFERKLKAQ